MIKSSSNSNVGGEENVQISIQHLQQLRQSLEDSLKLVNKYISQHSAETIYQAAAPEEKTLDLFPSTRTKTREDPKKISLGLCMFVQKKNLVGVNSRESLDTCKERCNRKAFNIKNGVILCSRHKESDIQRIEEILAGISEPPTPEQDSKLKPADKLPEGDYRKPPANKDGPSEDIEEVLNELGRLEKILEENRFIPCRLKFRECCLITFQGITYAVEPSGVCLGKISDKDAVRSFETKAKMKEYFDVEDSIEDLTYADLPFVETYELYYQPWVRE